MIGDLIHYGASKPRCRSAVPQFTFGMNRFVAIVLLVAATMGCRVGSPTTAFEQIVERCTADTNQFTLSQLQGLPPWTAMHVFAPYTPTETVHQQLGFHWKDAGRFRIHERDDIYLTVFVSGTNVVRVEEWVRSSIYCWPKVLGRALPSTSVLIVGLTKSQPTLKGIAEDAAPEPPPAAAVLESSESMNTKPENEAPADSGGR